MSSSCQMPKTSKLQYGTYLEGICIDGGRPGGSLADCASEEQLGLSLKRLSHSARLAVRGMHGQDTPED
jgi:hypothetical protein